VQLRPFGSARAPQSPDSHVGGSQTARGPGGWAIRQQRAAGSAWTAEQVAIGYSGQQEIEKIFRGLKDGDWLKLGPDVSLDRLQNSHSRFLLHAGQVFPADRH